MQPKLIKLKQPIELEFYDGEVTVTILKIGSDILQCAWNIAHSGPEVETQPARAVGRVSGPNGTSRIDANMVCRCDDPVCEANGLLQRVLETMVARIRGRTAAKVPEKAPASTWPIVHQNAG